MKKSTKILLWLLLGVPALILGIFALVKLYYYKTWCKFAVINKTEKPKSTVFWKMPFKDLKREALIQKNIDNVALEIGGK